MNIYKLINPTIEIMQKCYNNNFTAYQIYRISTRLQGYQLQYNELTHVVQLYNDNKQLYSTINLLTGIQVIYSDYYEKNEPLVAVNLITNVTTSCTTGKEIL